MSVFGNCCFHFTFPRRIFLDIHELIALEDYRDRKERSCLPVPLWAMVAGSVSQVLLVLNSSVNFAIYCCMSKEFRHVNLNFKILYLLSLIAF